MALYAIPFFLQPGEPQVSWLLDRKSIAVKIRARSHMQWTLDTRYPQRTDPFSR